eukprot:Selendium_serpulae@DN5227_c0_g1_i3.p2
MTDFSNAIAAWQKRLDALTASNPHCDDPRVLTKDQRNLCTLRYTMFCRCARELGDDHTRCKYQYYRAQTACPLEMVEKWDEQRGKGRCNFDILPDQWTSHLRE